MKTVWMLAGISLAAGIQFMVYCCLRMASREDEYLENARKREREKAEKEENE